MAILPIHPNPIFTKNVATCFLLKFLCFQIAFQILLFKNFATQMFRLILLFNIRHSNFTIWVHG